MLRTLVTGILAIVVGFTARTARADDVYRCKEADPATKIAATFKPEVSLMDLSAWVLGFTCKNIVFTPEVAKRATRVVIAAPNSMTPKQALQLFVDAVEATGLVVTVKPDSIVIKQGPGMPKSCPDLAPVKPADPTVQQSPPDPGPSDASYDLDLDKAIKKIDATHRTITRELIDRVLANPMAVAKGARFVPAVKDGKPAGFKLYAIRPSSIWARLGFENGDTLVSINGTELTDADKALELYVKIRDAKQWTVNIVRRGTPITLVFVVN